MKEKKSENPVYLRFDYSETLESKRDILYSQKNLGMMHEAVKEYFSLKDEEVKTKSKLRRKIRELLICIDALQKIAPRVEMPEILKKEYGQKNEPKTSAKKEDKKISKPIYEDSIESQLQEIQEKLNKIGKN